MEKSKLSWFDASYKKLKSNIVNKNTLKYSLSRSTYNGLTNLDFFQDVVERTLIKTGVENLDENTFVSMFWTTFKLQKMQAFASRNPRSKIHQNYVAIDESFDVADQSSSNLDTVILINAINKKHHEVVSPFLEGYTLAEISRSLGVSGSAVSQKYKKEVSLIRKTFNINN
jgi:hypothetical protein